MEPSRQDFPDHQSPQTPAWPPKPALPPDTPDIQIYSNPKRRVRMLLPGLFLIVLSAFNIWYGSVSHLLAFIFVGIVGIVFFGGMGIVIIALSLRRQPRVEITRSGLIDRSSAIGAGLIRWDEILGAEIHSTFGSKYLVVYVSDPEDVIRRQKPYKQKLMRKNVPIVGSPVAIAGQLLTMPLDQLRSHILERMGRAGASDNS